MIPRSRFWIELRKKKFRRLEKIFSNIFENRLAKTVTKIEIFDIRKFSIWENLAVDFRKFLKIFFRVGEFFFRSSIQNLLLGIIFYDPIECVDTEKHDPRSSFRFRLNRQNFVLDIFVGQKIVELHGSMTTIDIIRKPLVLKHFFGALSGHLAPPLKGLECSKRVENIINQENMIFYIEAIPQKKFPTSKKKFGSVDRKKNNFFSDQKSTKKNRHFLVTKIEICKIRQFSILKFCADDFRKFSKNFFLSRNKNYFFRS